MTEVKPYFYIHDRLGSVRLVVDENGAVQNSYTYDPFGQDISAADCAGNVYNPFKFTGQWFDDEIGQYYLRARMYDPQLMRFTGRDPVAGKFQQPLSLHKYLYCLNDSLNRTDPTGRFSLGEVTTSSMVSGLFGGIFKAINKAATASIAGLGAKGIAAQAGLGFMEGFGLGALSGGMASFSAQGFMWMGFKESITMYAASGAIGGAAFGTTEGLLKQYFSNDQNFYRWSDYTITGAIGGGFGGAFNALEGAESFMGDFGTSQFAVTLYDYFNWFKGLNERE